MLGPTKPPSAQIEVLPNPLSALPYLSTWAPPRAMEGPARLVNPMAQRFLAFHARVSPWPMNPRTAKALAKHAATHVKSFTEK